MKNRKFLASLAGVLFVEIPQIIFAKTRELVFAQSIAKKNT